jgi:hypothetical protein
MAFQCFFFLFWRFSAVPSFQQSSSSTVAGRLLAMMKGKCPIEWGKNSAMASAVPSAPFTL